MKGKRFVVISHCILNQNSVVNGLERAKGAFSFANKIISSDIGIIQLPCPELLFCGYNRPPKDFKEYNTEEFSEFCRRLLEPILYQIKVYLDNDFDFVGVIGIKNSPTCSIRNNDGVLMNVLFEELSKSKIKANFIEVPDNELNTIQIKEFEKIIVDFLEGD